MLVHSFLKLHRVFVPDLLSRRSQQGNHLLSWSNQQLPSWYSGSLRIRPRAKMKRTLEKKPLGGWAQVVERESRINQFSPSEEQKYFPVTGDAEETVTLENLLCKCVKI